MFGSAAALAAARQNSRSALSILWPAPSSFTHHAGSFGSSMGRGCPGNRPSIRLGRAMERSDELREALLRLQRDHDRLRTESELLRGLTEELRRNEQDALARAHLLSTIVNVLPVAVTVQGGDGRFMLINDAAAERLQVAPEDRALWPQ